MIPDWEYRVTVFEYLEGDTPEMYLNDVGREGWELVTVIPVPLTFYFKRQLPSPEDISFKESNKQIVAHLKEINDKNKRGARRT